MAVRAMHRDDAPQLPPHNLEAEQAVIGSLIIDRDAVIRVAPSLHVDDFYDARHGLIYGAMLDLYNRRVPTDLVTLIDELTRGGRLADVGDVPYLTEIVQAVPTAVHAEYYAGIVRECAARRRVIDVGTGAIQAAYDQACPLEVVYSQTAEALASAASGAGQDGYVSLRDMMERAYERFGQSTERRIPFGIAAFDARFGEMRPQQLTVIAARPGNGKSVLAVQIAYHNAIKHRRPVGMISLEMSADEIGERMLALSTRTDMYKVLNGTSRTQEADAAAVMISIDKLRERPFFCDDRVSGDLFQIQTRVRQMYAREKIELLIVDYLQMITTNSRENRAQEVGQISRSLKLLARELNIPVVALAQLNRNTEGRESGRPLLSDLRESGAIEQDSDRVVFIHHPYVYDKAAPVNVAELMVAKHRNGPVGTVSVKWVPEEVRFESIAN